MKFVISFLPILFGLNLALLRAAEVPFSEILRRQIIENGFKPARELFIKPDEQLVAVGKTIFESKAASLNGNIACQTCHLSEFGSGDGLPVAAAIYGEGEGPKRLLSGAKLLPRNTLPLWGRGAKGFNTFFWDGKVDFSGGKKISQFGSQIPSDDALVTAAHLPVVEIREMLDEDEFVRQHKQESVQRAKELYKRIAENLKQSEPQATRLLANYLKKSVKQLTYTDYAHSLAAFMRSEFRIRETKLERFVHKAESLTEEELRGGLIFYGKGRCVVCHEGPHFSDLSFHTVVFPQLGFGRNGFGIDYGRFNATFNPKDLYKFRTPPLYNVEKTAPYGHSGSVATLEDAIVAHFDPLRLVNVKKMNPFERYEFYKRLTLSSETANTTGYLSASEVKQIVAEPLSNSG